jgi:fibro-slime domain-containing protein
VSGDGCSANCTIEPLTQCTTGAPSVCTTTIRCGDGLVQGDEVCDPPSSTCATDCQSFIVAGALCGNGIWENSEGCDDGNTTDGDGCSHTCTVEAGWICPQANQCVKVPVCGDGVVNQTSEQCDDHNTAGGDGCSSDCKVEPQWFCSGLAPSHCVHEVCGDGIRTPTEGCDDHNTTPGDGCSSTCTVEDGWACPTAGVACMPKCGDGKVRGLETCDDGNTTSGDGCSANCRVEFGYACGSAADAGADAGPSAGPCVKAVCPNGITEPGEGCDDGNTIAGDGCGPTCQIEPTVTVGPNPTVNTFCGDGLKTGAEACDDGNTTSGDGCSSTCTIEAGFTCQQNLVLPGTVQMRVKVRDFKAGNALSPGGGHPDFDYHTGVDTGTFGIVGTRCDTGSTGTCGRLNAVGKPALIINDRAATNIRDANTFALWYLDSNAGNVQGDDMSAAAPGGVVESTIQMLQPFAKTITLTQDAVGSPSYTYTNNNFYPLAATEGFGNIGAEVANCAGGVKTMLQNTGWCTNNCCPCDAACRARNYGFTTELRYFFQYQGGETLKFTGDDDVWVFINGRLAVDVGGVHQALNAQVVLGDDGSPSGTDSDCSATINTALPDPTDCYTTAERNDTTDSRFGLTKGQVYEIVFFHAERHITASDFRLTLSGFLAPRSYCTPTCGDGIVAGGEACDDGPYMLDGGANDAGGVTINGGNWPDNTTVPSGRCSHSCTFRAYCGDGIAQPGEACDNGTNTDLYVTGSMTGKCAPGCLTPATCGDGIAQAAYEQCDLGTTSADGGPVNSNTTYGLGSCTTACHYGPYCGDNAKNGPAGVEDCDNGANNGAYGAGSCTLNCKIGPYCGDHIRNGPEDCDGTANCSATCTMTPHCGDNIKQAGEDCDWGASAASVGGTYGACNTSCQWNSHCGDGVVDPAYEECDKGAANNDTTYGGCRTDCFWGPRCGDGTTQIGGGEQCDNGYNNDVYKFSATSCAAGCKTPPSCGDGVLQSLYELCDNGTSNNDTTYNGCTTKCDWGPYCGDGIPNGTEQCDKGLDNGGYGPGSCTVDCKTGPYCGDGVRNGSEECDGTANCSASCMLNPFCGDNIKQAGEDCDWGASADNTSYGACNSSCRWNSHCGDGTKDTPPEECDLGPANNNATYNGCRVDCLLGPRCGDGIKQAGEVCDNGYNDDTYKVSSTSCGPGCTAVPFCGDSVLQPLYELCDNGAANSDTAYNGCSSRCDWGPYCGDGKVNGSELCDNGPGNRAYSATPGGCGYDCAPAPYCGDGVRNGPEQCDLGTATNTGAYGGCNADCTRAPYCGDHIVQTDQGERCDDGPTGSLTCTPLCANRDIK